MVHFLIYDIFVWGILCCVCSYAHKSLNCGVIGPLWRHQKAVSCLGWDKSISDTRVYETRRSWDHRLVHPGVSNKRRVSEIYLSQPRHQTALWWCHNGPVTSQLTDPIKWPIYPLESIRIYVHINTHNTESLTQGHHRSKIYNCYWYFCMYNYLIWVLMDGMHYFASQITITASP